MSNSHSDFILECKKASPSKGLIRANFDLENILHQYKDFASAISILTDEKYFQGDLNFITRATELVTQPILCKDFFIDPYQVYEARLYGADAILLMLSVLDDDTYTILSEIAESLKLDVLTEVHSTQELVRALSLNAKIIGINNRNLKDLSIDLATTEKLAPSLRASENRPLIISESGIETFEDIKRLSPLVDGFLIGSSIMAKNDIRHHCKSLLYGNVKICGLTKPDDAVAVDRNGGNYGGLVFYPPSPRFVDITKAKNIVAAAPLRYVGVFVNESVETMVEIAKTLGLFAVQLHGNESDKLINTLRKQLNEKAMEHVEIWKAIHVKTDLSITKNDLVNRYLFDNFEADKVGGTGKRFDWNLLNKIDSRDIILAGGINLENIKQATSKKHFAIDLSSGVETTPGEKSVEKIDQLFKAIRI